MNRGHGNNKINDIMKLNEYIEITNEDNMELMARYPDKYFDIAIIDPPYAVGASDGSFGNRGYDSKTSKLKHYANHDKTPEKEYFIELQRVAKNWIVWGANYYPQHFTHTGAIIWHKKSHNPLSDCEIAFQSFNKLVKYIWVEWQGFLKNGEKGDRIHPNQKPIELYERLIKEYAKPNDKILDTHFGSGSIACAVHKANIIDKMDLSLVACELDKDYFESSIQRVKEALQTQSLF